MRAQQKTGVGRITVERNGHDVNGNPKFRVALSIEGQDPIFGTTPAGASYCYSMPRDGVARCTWHVTPSGRLVFDDIQKA